MNAVAVIPLALAVMGAAIVAVVFGSWLLWIIVTNALGLRTGRNEQDD